MIDDVAAPARFSLTRADRWPMLWLVLVPAVLFALPALAGHPPIAGDNLIQNFPLRVLVGRQLADGHLPVWNPYVFSGTPLLGALNAGALYPLTFLFAALPAQVAWWCNLTACYWAAGIGTYVLCRWLGRSVTASMLGAVLYAAVGMMWVQMVHLGVIQGQSWLPLLVLATLMVGDRLRGPGASATARDALLAAGWPLLGVAALSAMICLTGEPRAITDLEIAMALVTAVVVLRRDEVGGLVRRCLLGGSLGVAVVVGALTSMAEVWPGEKFIALSQRADLGYGFFGSGSIALSKTAMLVVPDFFGGIGLLHQPSYFVDYNLPEVGGYLGLLGMTGLAAAVAGLVGRGPLRGVRNVGVFVLLAAFGLVAAWGTFTPFGHVLYMIPLLGKTRLQSRNLVFVNLAAAVLGARFADAILRGDRSEAGLVGWRRWLTFFPAGAGLALIAGALLVPTPLYEQLGATATQAVEGHFMALWLLVSGVLLAAWILVLVRSSTGDARRVTRRALIWFMVIDVAFFWAVASTGLVTGDYPTQPSRAQASAVLGTKGRFALVDPGLNHFASFIVLGKPDTNIFTGLKSIQGYGSLISTTYQAATAAHQQDGLDPCQLALGRYSQLRLASLVVASHSIAPPIAIAAADGTGLAPLPVAAEPACVGAPRPAQATSRTFFLGQDVALTHVFLSARSTAVMADAALASSLRVTVLGPQGRVHEVPTRITTSSIGWSIAFPTSPSAAGIRITGPVHQVMDASTATDSTGAVYWLGGPFQDALDDGAWHLTGTQGTMQSFVAASPIRAGAWITAGHGRVLSRTTTTEGAETDVVDLSTPATLVRSESWLPGWHATVSAVGSSTSHEGVVRAHDLVQAVRLGPGRWRVTFGYRAPGMEVGLAGSAVGLLGLLGGLAVLLVRRRSRRGGRVRP
jgi:hypothetical protein